MLSGILGSSGLVESLAHALYDEGHLDLQQAFIEGSFAPAKQGAAAPIRLPVPEPVVTSVVPCAPNLASLASAWRGQHESHPARARVLERRRRTWT